MGEANAGTVIGCDSTRRPAASTSACTGAQAAELEERNLTAKLEKQRAADERALDEAITGDRQPPAAKAPQIEEGLQRARERRQQIGERAVQSGRRLLEGVDDRTTLVLDALRMALISAAPARTTSSSTTPIAAANTPRSTTSRRWPITASWPRSARSATPTTTRWPRASSTPSRPSSSATASGAPAPSSTCPRRLPGLVQQRPPPPGPRRPAAGRLRSSRCRPQRDHHTHHENVGNHLTRSPRKPRRLTTSCRSLAPSWVSCRRRSVRDRPGSHWGCWRVRARRMAGRRIGSRGRGLRCEYLSGAPPPFASRPRRPAEVQEGCSASPPPASCPPGSPEPRAHGHRRAPRRCVRRSTRSRWRCRRS